MTKIVQLSYNQDTKEVLVQPEGHKVQDGYESIGPVAAGTYYEGAREALRDKYGITDMSQITIHADDEVGKLDDDPDVSTQFQNNQERKSQEVEEARNAGEIPENAQNGELLTGQDTAQTQPVVTEVPDTVEEATQDAATNGQPAGAEPVEQEEKQPVTEEQTASEQEEEAQNQETEEEDK